MFALIPTCMHPCVHTHTRVLRNMCIYMYTVVYAPFARIVYCLSYMHMSSNVSLLLILTNPHSPSVSTTILTVVNDQFVYSNIRRESHSEGHQSLVIINISHNNISTNSNYYC